MSCPFPTTRERKWPQVILTPITIANHIVTVSSTILLHTKQIVILSKTGQETKEFEIKRILSDTQFHLGPKDSGRMQEYANPIEFNGGMLTMPEQNRNPMSGDIVLRAVYEEENAVALRNILVDWKGSYYCEDNPLPVQLSDGSINIENVNANVSVQLTHLDNWPNPGDIHDSVRIGDGVDLLVINSDGSINVKTTEPTLIYKIINLSMPLANTNYTQALPLNTHHFTVKVRDGKGVLRLYEAPGDPEYLTVGRGGAYYSGDVNSPSLSVTAQVSQPNCHLEFICWVPI